MSAWLVLFGAKGDTSRLQAQLKLEIERHEDVNADGWDCWNLTGVGSLADLELLAADTLDANVPWFATYSADDDFSFAMGGVAPQLEWCLVFNEKAARDSVEGDWAIRRAVQAAGKSEWSTPMCERAARWSQAAPQAVDAQFLRALVDREWQFAWEALYVLLDGFELSVVRPTVDEQLEGLVAPLSLGVLKHGSFEVNGTFARYLMGQGRDFIGIWDRRKSGPPLDRFSNDEEGLKRATLQWFYLVTGDRASGEPD